MSDLRMIKKLFLVLNYSDFVENEYHSKLFSRLIKYLSSDEDAKYFFVLIRIYFLYLIYIIKKSLWEHAERQKKKISKRNKHFCYLPFQTKKLWILLKSYIFLKQTFSFISSYSFFIIKSCIQLFFLFKIWFYINYLD